jgi:hypothetical protein
LMLLSSLVLACAPGRAGGGPTSSPAPSAPSPSPSPSPPVKTPVDFATKVRPILQEKCSPCHFAGGRMYDTLPFDQEGTVRVLGPAMFSRLRDPVDVELLREFLGVTE